MHNPKIYLETLESATDVREQNFFAAMLSLALIVAVIVVPILFSNEEIARFVSLILGN